MPDYREVPDEDSEAFQATTRYAFRPTAGPPTDEELADAVERDDRLGDPRGLYDGEDLLVVCKHHWFETWLRGGWRDLAGLASVASPPEHRRGGLVRQLLADSLAEYRDRGAAYSALWPFDYGFYRQYGWAEACRYGVAECDPDALAFADDDRSGEFRRLGPDDWRALHAVNETRDEDVALHVRRTESWWRRRVFEGFDDDPYVYGWEADGDLRGYLVYRVEDGDDGRELVVLESSAADPEARRHLLRFCHYHDSQVETVRLYCPPEPTLMDLVADPGDVEFEVVSGPMVRLVDVADGLSGLATPGTATGAVTLAVSDPLADWNDGRFALSVADGRTRCVPAAGAAPDASLDVGALSQLAVGHCSAGRLAETGELDADAGVVDALDAVFPSRDVVFKERF